MEFLTAIVVMCIATFLYQKVQKVSVEVAVGCISVTLISLIVAIVTAPWPVQMVMLVGLLASPTLTKVDWLH
jgi:hypothetical protein